MKKLLLSVFVVTTLVGCSGSSHEDIKSWMKEQEQQLKGKIELLPPAKSYSPVIYKAEVDPFIVKEKLSLTNLVKDRYAPDFNREKDYLEDFNLEELRMIGTVIKDGRFYAMIRDRNKSITYVNVNNYMGKNYGKVTLITEGEILLEERIKNDDQWIVKNTKIDLYEGLIKK